MTLIFLVAEMKHEYSALILDAESVSIYYTLSAMLKAI